MSQSSKSPANGAGGPPALNHPPTAAAAAAHHGGQPQQQQSYPGYHQFSPHPAAVTSPLVQQVALPAEQAQQQQQQQQQQMQYPTQQPQMQQQQQLATTQPHQPSHAAAAATMTPPASTEPPGDESTVSSQEHDASFAHRLRNPLHNLSQRLLSPTTAAEQEARPNVGFHPTPAMVKKHEEEVSSSSKSSRPLYQFQITKLRSWRTGYVRLLCLYEHRFLTMDPDSHETTNTWSYAVLTDWLSIPKEKDSILLQVNADKLKFKCHHVDRARVLTALLECKYNFFDNQQQQQRQDAEEQEESQKYPTFRQCARQTRHGTRVDMSLQVAPHGLLERHPVTNAVLQTYRYVDLAAVSFTADDSTGIVLHQHHKSSSSSSSSTHAKSRLFFIQSSRRHGNGRSDLLTVMREQYETLGLELQVSESCTLASWLQQRRALGRTAGPMVSSWDVTKTTRRHDASLVGPTGGGWLGGTVSRKLVVTGKGWLLEMDSGGVVSMRSLRDLHAMVRHAHSDTLTLEYKTDLRRTFASSDRDALLVSLLDAAASLAGNAQVHVSNVTSGGYCLSSLTSVAESPAAAAAAATSGSSSGGMFQPISIPMHCLKRMHAVSTAAYAFLCHSTEVARDQQTRRVRAAKECAGVVEACREFNASIPPTGEGGLPQGVNDRTVLGCVGALWGLVSKLLERPQDPANNQNHNSRDWHEAETVSCPMFEALFRLSQTPAGYKGTTELDTMQDSIGLLWHVEDVFCKFWALRVLSVLLSGPKQRDLEAEFVNKRVILRTGGSEMVDGLVSTMLHVDARQPGGQRLVSDLILMVTSDILQSLLCSNYDTTSPEHFAAFISALAKGYRALLSALRSPTPFVIENTALLLHLLSTHEPEAASAIREASLTSGILLQHFHAAVFSPLEGQRFLSRYLCSLWLSGPMDCDEKRLLKRMVPSGFLPYLNVPILSRMEEDQLDALERDSVMEQTGGDETGTISSVNTDLPSGAAGTNTARLRSRIALAHNTATATTKPENFRIFFHVLTKDHALADLIWNQQTRQELRVALENEIQSIHRVTEARGGIDRMAWNHQQFTVAYPSLDHEVKVGSVYMRLWLQAGDGFIRSWEEPERLFELLFRRFLCELDRNSVVTNMCIRCLERLYKIHAKDIGPFPDAMILVRSMASTKNIETQHRLLSLVATVLGVSDDEDRYERVDIPENAEQLLNMESIGQLCQFVAWGHTNGVQVGNLLTSVLASAEKKKAMITDGQNSGPLGGDQLNSNSDNQDQSSPLLQYHNDTSCPAVWYVASTGRVPPPPERIRGPFRISDLAAMFESGKLSEYDQVTASQVDDYEEYETESSNVKEAHIDTGRWRRINQVWQLRWQLFTDAGTEGIYEPSAIALMAIRSLTRLVDLHRSLDSRGVAFFPVPIAKRLLCGLSREPGQTKWGSTEAHLSIDQRDALSILSQSLLCNDHRVVDSAADLMYKLMLHNSEAVSKFYLTGIFLFCCCYTGSNFKSLAKLLEETHLKQHFRSGFSAAADESELSAKDRSILGNMFPDGLLFILVNYGVERFTEVFVGNFDTPEVIWSFEMRLHLVEMIRQHLGDFPKRLWQHTTAKYEYCPIPGIAYKKLEKEIFCHNYYLNNLCDETRFPDWPIAEPVQVFRACLEEWKLQLNRDGVKEEDAKEQARKILKLKSGDGGKELRKSYRNLARKFHPDKNPGGRDTFEAIQSAYELLLPVVESGGRIAAAVSAAIDEPDEIDVVGKSEVSNAWEGLYGGMSQMQTMHLLVKTQLLICKRYPEDMSKYKYPAYGMLLSGLQLPKSCEELSTSDDIADVVGVCLLKKERAYFVETAAELVFQTCLVSPLNAEELIAEDGLRILASLLRFYVLACTFVCDESRMRALPAGTSASVASAETVLSIVSHLVHTIAGVAYFDNGRKRILEFEVPGKFCSDWRLCLEGKFGSRLSDTDGVAHIKKYALEGIANMAKEEKLQNIIIGSGVVWPLLRYLLAFDPTLDSGTTTNDQDDLNMSQATSNVHARLAARALGMLCGMMKDPELASPTNSSLVDALCVLLTRPIALMLRNKRSTELLRMLNSNIETPTRIWNVEMRKELNSFLLRMDAERPEGICRSVEDELCNALNSFRYQSLEDEVIIGGVYLRVFNNMGEGRESLREIPSSTAFATHVIRFIGKCLNRSSSQLIGFRELPEPSGDIDDKEEPESVLIDDSKFLMALRALSHLAKIDGLVEEVLCNPTIHAPAVLLSLLELPTGNEALDCSRDILSVVTPKEAFANAVSEQGTLWRLLALLERPSLSGDDVRMSEREDDAARMQRNWSLLDSLASSPSIALQLVRSTGWLELLGIVAGHKDFTKAISSRVGAAKTLSRLLWDSSTGPNLRPLVERFVPVSLVVVLREQGPDEFLKRFDEESESPELIWNATMRSELRAALASVLDDCLKARRNDGAEADAEFVLPATAGARYKNLEGELFIGGVYVRLFLKEPTFGVRDPTGFLEKLLIRWTQELETITVSAKKSQLPSSSSETTTLAEAQQDALLPMVTSAIVYLCKIHDSLCDKLAHLGYMTRSLTLLDEVILSDLVGTPLLSIVRLLHVAAGRMVNVESIILLGESDGTRGIVDFTIQAIGSPQLHRDSAFMVEMLKRVFATALGKVKDAQKRTGHWSDHRHIPPHGTSTYGEEPISQPSNSSEFYVMAPSPAPGIDPVRGKREKVTFDDPLANPLAFSGDAVAPEAGASSSEGMGPVSAPIPAETSQPRSNRGRPVTTQVNQEYSARQIFPPGSKLQTTRERHDEGAGLPLKRGDGPALGATYSGEEMAGTTFPVTVSQTTHYIQPGFVAANPPRAAQYQPPAVQQPYGLPNMGESTTTVESPRPHVQPTPGSQQIPGTRLRSADSNQAGFPRQHSQLQTPHQSVFNGGTFVHSQIGPRTNQVPHAQMSVAQTTPSEQLSYVQRSAMHSAYLSQQTQPPNAQLKSSQSLRSEQQNQSQTQPDNFQSMYAAPQQRVVQQQQAPPQTQPQLPPQQGGMQAPHPQNQTQPSTTSSPFAQTESQSAERSLSQHTATSPFTQTQYAASAGLPSQQTTPMSPSSFASAQSQSTNGIPPQQTTQQLPMGTSPAGFPNSTTEAPVPAPYAPSPIEGSGIDARSAADPKQIAEQQALSTAGAPGSAQGRIALLESAIFCGLPKFLLEDVLENPTLRDIKDPAGCKVHSVELLKLLTMDPGYGFKFDLILDSMSAWKKYKSQDHSLFITASEQKADYFLTAGETTKLLTEG